EGVGRVCRPEGAPAEPRGTNQKSRQRRPLSREAAPPFDRSGPPPPAPPTAPATPAPAPAPPPRIGGGLSRGQYGARYPDPGERINSKVTYRPDNDQRHHRQAPNHPIGGQKPREPQLTSSMLTQHLPRTAKLGGPPARVKRGFELDHYVLRQRHGTHMRLRLCMRLRLTPSLHASAACARAASIVRRQREERVQARRCDVALETYAIVAPS